MQKMIDRLSTTCKDYGMEINVKKTKVMIMNGTAKPKGMQRFAAFACVTNCCILRSVIDSLASE